MNYSWEATVSASYKQNGEKSYKMVGSSATRTNEHQLELKWKAQ